MNRKSFLTPAAVTAAKTTWSTLSLEEIAATLPGEASSGPAGSFGRPCTAAQQDKWLCLQCCSARLRRSDSCWSIGAAARSLASAEHAPS